MSFVKIDDTEKYVQALLKEGFEPFTAVKKDDARVVAREGIVGEEIVTFTKDGEGKWAETVHTITADEQGRPEWVITMADKEGNPIVIDDAGHYNTYTNTAEAFEKYTPVKEGVYKQIQEERLFLEIDEDICITPSWGGEMNLPKGSMLNITNFDDIYGVAKHEFNLTYDIVEQEPKKARSRDIERT